MNGTARAVAGTRTLRRRLGRPEGISENTRWLFAVLSLVTILVSAPAALTSARGPTLLLALAAALVLTASFLGAYLTRRAPLGRDVLDAAAMAAFAVASTNPVAVFGIVFAGLWFGALYGSIWRSLLRCGLYSAAIGATAVLWPLVPGHPGSLAAAALFGPLPTMFLTVVVARQIGSGLLARDQGLQRDAALAAIGSRLLGMTDQGAIRAMAWCTAAEICDATPGLRILKAVRAGGVLRVEGASGGFRAVPARLPVEVIASDTEPAEATRVDDPDPLDAAAGCQLEWVCIDLTEQPEDAWLVVGAPKRIPPAAMLAVRCLVNEVSLALRNSDVHDALTAQARLDSLTGLANRASFTAELAIQLTHRERAGALHVLFLDLDDFKNVNDILGHRAGDELLVDIAARLRACTRPDDVCARLGGDEFAVVLHDTTDAAAIGIAQRMVDLIAEPVYLSGRTARVGASIGVAAGRPGIEMEELVHQADVAMYAAKAQGKGQVQVFNSGLLHADSSRLTLERQLAVAATVGELVVHYQPILSMDDRRCTAVEALVRWRHPERGLLQPGDFIEIAERTGAIVGIGAIVMRQACADVARWHTEHPGAELAMHINVSARQLDHDQFIDTVTSCLAEFQIPPAQLVLELTETVVLNSPAAIERLKVLAAHGVKIAIDDFGTGYSSLTTLRSLPVDVVKLDRTFLAGALANTIDRTVIRAIVQMSAELGLQTIAEGVERPEQQRFLEAIGTDAMQGYLHLRPVPVAQLATWLRDNLREEPVVVGDVVRLRAGR